MSRVRLRVLVAETGPETETGTETGTHLAAVVLGRLLRDEGMEVVYAGPLRSAEQILRTAEQEDPDAVGLVGPPLPAGLLADLEPGLADLRLFTVADHRDPSPDPGHPDSGHPEPEHPQPGPITFRTPRDAAKWLAGGRAHTSGGPSDRAR